MKRRFRLVGIEFGPDRVKETTMLQPYAHFVIIAVAVFVAMGGVMGFVKAKSKISLIMGLASAALLGVTAYLASAPDTAKMGVIGSLVLMFLLDTMFSVRFAKTKKVMPNLVMMIILVPAMAYMAVILFKEM
jgi:uncharacterized membrane protein (UPF0136 family)